MTYQHRAFLGDAERPFAITPTLIPELEAKTGTGIGTLFRRVIAVEFRHADVVETIRLALIGGGENPAEAERLVRVYVAGRPLAESYPLAVAVLEALWFGAPKQVAP